MPVQTKPRLTDTRGKTRGFPGPSTSSRGQRLYIYEPDGTRLILEMKPQVRGEVRVLAAWWHEATDGLSSPQEKTKHEAYLRIIEMGRPALRYILEDLRDRGGHWFHALEEITGMQPKLPANISPSVRVVRDAWLMWGQRQGLLD